MLHLISLNIELDKHYGRVFPFLTEKNPDVICLQEVPRNATDLLRALGYCTVYLPMFTRELESQTHEVGITIASRTPLCAWSYYYHTPKENLTRNKEGKLDHRSFGYIMSETVVNGEHYRIGTTHFWDSADGHADAMQQSLMRRLIPALESELPHVLCGDFNIPRDHNTLYEKLADRYNESIPLHYHSSLDRNLHKLGKTELDEPIFDEYMVDYVLTQEPYIATETKLHFGVSDHAAVSSTIVIRP